MRLNSLSFKLLLSALFVSLVLIASGCNQKGEISFSEPEKESLLSLVSEKYPNVEILDYTFSAKNYLIQAAFLCKDINTGAETILIYITDTVLGCMDVASGVLHYKHTDSNGIHITEANSVSTISFSFTDSQNKAPVDYEISFWSDENDIINFRIQDNLQ